MEIGSLEPQDFPTRIKVDIERAVTNGAGYFLGYSPNLPKKETLTPEELQEYVYRYMLRSDMFNMKWPERVPEALRGARK